MGSGQKPLKDLQKYPSRMFFHEENQTNMVPDLDEFAT